MDVEPARALDQVLELGLLDQVVAHLDSDDSAALSTERQSLALWHSLAFLELVVRQSGKYSTRVRWLRLPVYTRRHMTPKATLSLYWFSAHALYCIRL